MHPLYTKSSYPVQTRSSMDCEVHSEDEKKKGRLYCNLFLGSTCTIGRFRYSDPKNLSIHNYLFHIGRVITLRDCASYCGNPLVNILSQNADWRQNKPQKENHSRCLMCQGQISVLFIMALL